MRVALRPPNSIGLLQAAATITAVFSLATLANSWHRYLELFSHFRRCPASTLGGFDAGACGDQFESEQPDLVVLQEVSDLWADAMSTLRSDYAYRHVMPQLDNFGIAVYSRQPLLSVEVISSPPLDLPSLVIQQAMGDLNTAMWGHHYKKLVADTGLKNARDGFGIIPTWPGQLPFALIPIDHCLVSDNFVVLDIRSGPAIGSDHLPLIVTLSLLR